MTATAVAGTHSNDWETRREGGPNQEVTGLGGQDGDVMGTVSGNGDHWHWEGQPTLRIYEASEASGGLRSDAQQK